jgi:hypothetical protein
VHQIEVHTSSTLGEILSNREATGNIAKWAIELSMYDIVYKLRTAIKAQALSDFVAEWAEMQKPPMERELECWTINFDGSLQFQGEGAGILVISPKGESFKYVMQMHFQHLTMQSSMKHCFMVYGSPRHSASADSMLSGTHCSLSIRPTKSGHVWMTKCCYIARSFTS